jgi:putative component of toxin-antitoxin plasmid stabilization module
MEIYFNPYPGAAKTEEEGLRLAVGTADALSRLKNECTGMALFSVASQATSDLPPTKFILIRNANIEFTIGAVIFKTAKTEREKLKRLLDLFSHGRVIDDDDLLMAEDWIVSAVDAPAPILELAAKNNAIALTIPTEVEWQIDPLCFNGRSEKLHNLWGQENISSIITHCHDSIKNSAERFSVRFSAIYCPGALNSAPNTTLWDSFGFFQIMERAQKRNYEADDNLIKDVDDTKYGPLLELRMYGPGHRIFFVYRKDSSPKILVGGFYQKNESLSQDDAIKKAKKCVDKYSED